MTGVSFRKCLEVSEQERTNQSTNVGRRPSGESRAVGSKVALPKTWVSITCNHYPRLEKLNYVYWII